MSDNRAAGESCEADIAIDYFKNATDLDPNLESIRDLPDFIAIREEIRADLATQAVRLSVMTHRRTLF